MRLEQWRYALPLRLRSLFQRSQLESELDEELEDHLERKTQEFVERGMVPVEARRAAVRAKDHGGCASPRGK